MEIAPPERRSTVAETAEGLAVSIPAKRNIFLLLFLSLWLVGWGFGEVTAGRELLSKQSGAPDLFLGVWLTLWTLGGGLALYAWFWMIGGREVLIVRPDALVIRRVLLGRGRDKEYDIQQVKNLRAAPPTWNPYDFSSAMHFWGVGGGPIAFDYGSKTIRIGSGVDESEAQQVVKDLKSRHVG